MGGRTAHRFSLLIFLLAPLLAECAKAAKPADSGRTFWGVSQLAGKKGARVKLNDDDNKVVHLQQVR